MSLGALPAGRPLPALRCAYMGQRRALGNLGDFLVPHLLAAFGFRCALPDAPDAEVANPGRCLLVVGSLLTARDLDRLPWQLDVWGCGWKGLALAPAPDRALRCFAVRGPETARALGLPPHIPLGDPTLLLPSLRPAPPSHRRTLVIPHLHRLEGPGARARCRATGCDEALSTLVLRPAGEGPPRARAVATLAGLYLRRGLRVRTLWQAVDRIAGADFVLTGSLHGAILAQAYGVPWAGYTDGAVDAPAKWTDWGAYLGIDLEMVGTLAEGRAWWERSGRFGQVRDLGLLRAAFPSPGSQPHPDR